jgi:hypothetical protein
MPREALTRYLFSSAYDRMSKTEHEAKLVVEGVMCLCVDAAKTQSRPMKLRRPASRIYESLMIVPRIFDEAVLMTNAEIRDFTHTAGANVASGLVELQCFGLIDRSGAKFTQKVRLCTPDWLVNYRNARSDKFGNEVANKGPRMSFAQALRVWTDFTATLDDR